MEFEFRQEGRMPGGKLKRWSSTTSLHRQPDIPQSLQLNTVPF